MMNSNLNNGGSAAGGGGHRGVAWFQQHSPSPPSSTSSSRSSGSTGSTGGGRNLLFPDVAMTSPTTLIPKPSSRATTPRRSPAIATTPGGSRRSRQLKMQYPHPPPRAPGAGVSASSVNAMHGFNAAGFNNQYSSSSQRSPVIRHGRGGGGLSSSDELELVDVIDIEDEDPNSSCYAAFFVDMPSLMTSSSSSTSKMTSSFNNNYGISSHLKNPSVHNYQHYHHHNNQTKNNNQVSPSPRDRHHHHHTLNSSHYHSPSMHFNTPSRKMAMVLLSIIIDS